jgi:hypothetical protein
MILGFSETEIILVLLVLGLAGLCIYVWRIRAEERELEKEYYSIEEEISKIKENNYLPEPTSIDEEDFSETDLDSLASQIMDKLKEKHGLSATTYKELVDQISKTEIESERKNLLESFFKLNIKLQYSDEELESKEDEELKSEARQLVRSMEESPEEK